MRRSHKHLILTGKSYWSIGNQTPKLKPVCIYLLCVTFVDHHQPVREGLKQLKKDFEKTEDDLKALQSVGQIIGEVLRQLDDEKCM